MDDPTPQVRISAATQASVLASKDRRAVPVLLRALSDRDKLVREFGVRLLTVSRSGGGHAREELAKLLKDKEPAIRIHAAVALMNLTGDKDKYEAIPLEALSAKESSVRATAALALGADVPRSEEIVQALKGALNDAEETVRLHAAYALIINTGKVEAGIDVLMNGIHSADRKVRAWAMDHFVMMARTEKGKALSVILKATEDKDANVRALAIGALSELEVNRQLLLKIYTRGLTDEAPVVRKGTLVCIGYLRESGLALEGRVRAALQEKDEEVRTLSRLSLSMIKE